MGGHYTGPVRVAEHEFGVKYGEGKTIFVEPMHDIATCTREDRVRIFHHCATWPTNVYVFQSKDPVCFWKVERVLDASQVIFGTTIETNRWEGLKIISQAPEPIKRADTLEGLKRETALATYVTIEPIMDFDLEEMQDLILRANPSFINIGADSKGYNLPEPSADKVRVLITWIRREKIELKLKSNLKRILGGNEMEETTTCH
jgi:hypothetical protein